jgi:hypothetical protein
VSKIVIDKIKEHIVEYLSDFDCRTPSVLVVEDDTDIFHFVEYIQDNAGGIYNVYAVINLNTNEIIVSSKELSVGLKRIMRIYKIFDMLDDK